MTNDPLEILIVPHAVLEWQQKRGMFVKRFFPKQAKQEREKGKWAIFHGTIRLWELFDTENAAAEKIEEMMGEKKKCWENKRIYSIKQL